MVFGIVVMPLLPYKVIHSITFARMFYLTHGVCVAIVLLQNEIQCVVLA